MSRENQTTGTIEGAVVDSQTRLRTEKETNERSFRTQQQMLGMDGLKDLNPLLIMLLSLFLGKDFQQVLLGNTEERSQAFTNNTSDYGTISRQTVSENSTSNTSETIQNFPVGYNFTRAYQQTNTQNRVFEGTDTNGNEISIIKAANNTQESAQSWANNNPGNLRYSAWQDDFGAIGKDNNGFAIFENITSGLEAQQNLIRSDSYANLTLRETAYRYAPQNSDGSEAYVQEISRTTGIPLTQTLDTLTEAQKTALVTAIANHQNIGNNNAPTADANTASQYGTSTTSGLFVAKPLDSVVTSDFGPRSVGMHRGIDLRTKSLDPNGHVPLYARNNMVITDISENAGGYGYRVSAAIGKDDQGRVITVQFSHLDELPQHIHVGDTLRAGDYIATTGTSGRTFGPHLDFEVRIGAQLVDPEKAFETDLSNSRNGDVLIASAQNILGAKAYSGTYNARIAPSLANASVMSAVNNLEITPPTDTRLASFNNGGTVENDPQQPIPLQTSFGTGEGTNEVELAANAANADATLTNIGNPEIVGAPTTTIGTPS